MVEKVAILSDVHLVECSDQRGRALLSFLQSLDRSMVSHVVLNGDILDFCFGATSYFKKKFAPLEQALLRLIALGIRVIYVQGNHEFSLASLGWRGVEFCLGEEYVIKLKQGQPLAICHGDRLLAPWHYRLYLMITHSRLFRYAAVCVPQAFLDRLALKISAKSRSRDVYRSLPHQKIESAAFDWLQRLGVSHGVMGHFHHPYHLRRSGATGSESEILCPDSWQKPSVLYFDGHVFTRVYL